MILAAGKRVNKSFRLLKSSCRQQFIDKCRKPGVPVQADATQVRRRELKTPRRRFLSRRGGCPSTACNSGAATGADAGLAGSDQKQS